MVDIRPGNTHNLTYYIHFDRSFYRYLLPKVTLTVFRSICLEIETSLYMVGRLGPK